MRIHDCQKWDFFRTKNKCQSPLQQRMQPRHEPRANRALSRTLATHTTKVSKHHYTHNVSSRSRDSIRPFTFPGLRQADPNQSHRRTSILPEPTELHRFWSRLSCQGPFAHSPPPPPQPLPLHPIPFSLSPCSISQSWSEQSPTKLFAVCCRFREEREAQSAANHRID